MRVREIYQELETALNDAGVRVYTKPGANIETPAVIIAPPGMTWEQYFDEPSGMSFILAAVVKVQDNMLESFWTLIDQIKEAVENNTNGVIVDAVPSYIEVNNATLPCYEISVEF